MISIIIPTRNRQKLLKNTLLSISNLISNDIEFEILIIDNNSTDDTKKISESFKNKLPLKIYKEEKEGLLFGRHRGFFESSGEILAFIDDDVELNTNWLISIDNFFNNDKDLVLCGGNCIPKFESEPPNWLKKLWNKKIDNIKKIDWLSLIEVSEKFNKISANNIWGCNFIIKKSFLKNIGGFHPDGFPKDKIFMRGDGENNITDYVLKHNLKYLFSEKLTVKHIVTKSRMNYNYVFRRGYNQGISRSFFKIRNVLKGNDRFIVFKTFLKFIFSILKFFSQLISFGYDISKINLIFDFGSIWGYYKHQLEFKNDEKLKFWIFKDNYLSN